MKILSRVIIAGLLFSPLFVIAQEQNVEPARPLPTPTTPAREPFSPMPVRELQNRPTEQMLRSREEMQRILEAQRERLREVSVLERPMLATDITQTRMEMAQLMRERQQAALEALRQKREALVDEAAQRRVGVLENYLMRFGQVLEQRIERLTALADRVNERLVRLEEDRGVDLSAARTLLDEAYALLADASEKAEAFSSKTLDATDGTTAQAAAEELKVLRQEVQEAIRAAHQKLSEAIAAIREGLSTINN